MNLAQVAGRALAEDVGGLGGVEFAGELGIDELVDELLGVGDGDGMHLGAWLALVKLHGAGPLLERTPEAGRPAPSTTVEQAVRTRATDRTAALRMITAAD